MSTAVLGAPPAAGAPAPPAPGRATLALARVEGVRLLRHPAVLAAYLLLLWLWAGDLVTGAADRHPELAYASVDVALACAVPAAAVLLAANLAVLRARRHRVEVVTGVLPLPPWRRTLAHLLSVSAPAAVVLLLAAARMLRLALAPGAAGRVEPAEVAVGPVLVLLGGAAGVLLARLVRAVAAAPLVLAAGFAVVLFGLGGLLPYRAQRLVPVDPPDVNTGGLLPGDLLGRPSGAHLAYLLALVAAVAAAALLRSGAPRVAAGVTAAVAAATVVVTGAAQLRVPSAELTARRLAAADAPARFQRCEPRGTVTYCAFPDYLPHAAVWARVVEDVRGRLPAPAADRPFAVRQRVPEVPSGEVYRDSGVTHIADRSRWPVDDAAAGTPLTVSVGVGWDARAQVRHLAAQTAYVLATGGPVVDPETVTGGVLACGGAGVLVWWSAWAVDPGLLRGLDDYGGTGDRSFDGMPTGAGVTVGSREAEVARRLTAQPPERVAAALARSWPALTARTTSVDRVAALLGVPAPPPLPAAPTEDEQFRGECR